MSSLKYYNVKIDYDGTVKEPIVTGTITFPDGSQSQFQRHSEMSCFSVKNGPFVLGRNWYTIQYPTGIARFDSFDDLMQRGFGLTRELIY
jgi:hypothetical protein